MARFGYDTTYNNYDGSNYDEELPQCSRVVIKWPQFFPLRRQRIYSLSEDVKSQLAKFWKYEPSPLARFRMDVAREVPVKRKLPKSEVRLPEAMAPLDWKDIFEEIVHNTPLHKALIYDLALLSHTASLQLGPRARQKLDEAIEELYKKAAKERSDVNCWLRPFIRAESTSCASDPLARISVQAQDTHHYNEELQSILTELRALCEKDREDDHMSSTYEFAVPSGSYGFKFGAGGESHLIGSMDSDSRVFKMPKEDIPRKICLNRIQQEYPSAQILYKNDLTAWERMCLENRFNRQTGAKSQMSSFAKLEDDDVVLRFANEKDRENYLSKAIWEKIKPFPLETLPGYDPMRSGDQPELFWYVRWICHPIDCETSSFYGNDPELIATIKLTSVRDINKCKAVLAKHNFVVEDKTRFKSQSRNDPLTTKKLFVVSGLKICQATTMLAHDYIGAILRANDVAYEDIYLNRVRRNENDKHRITMLDEMAKIRKRIFMESRKLEAPLGEQTSYYDFRDDELDNMKFFKDASLDWPFEVLKGRMEWCSESGQLYDVTGIPIDNNDDETAEVVWKNLELAETYTRHFADLTPDGCQWHMRLHDRVGVRLTFGYRTTIYVPATIRHACSKDLIQLDKDLRMRDPPLDAAGKDELVARERYWAQLIDDGMIKGNDTDEPICRLIVEGYPRNVFDEALAAVRRLLSGERIDCSNMQNEGKLLYGHGAAWLRAAVSAHSGDILYDVDLYKKAITLVGDLRALAELTEDIRDYVNHSDDYYISTTLCVAPPRFPNSLRLLLGKFDIERLSEISGGASIRTNTGKKWHWTHLEFHGNLTQWDKLNEWLNDVVEQLPALLLGPSFSSTTLSLSPLTKTFALSPCCPVCFNTIKSAHYCLEACGHYYCLECYSNMIQNSVQSRQLEFICMVEGCGKPIEAEDVMCIILGDDSSRLRWFDAMKLEPFVRALKDKTACRDAPQMRICPTPNCYGLMMVEASDDLYPKQLDPPPPLPLAVRPQIQRRRVEFGNFGRRAMPPPFGLHDAFGRERRPEGIAPFRHAVERQQPFVADDGPPPGFMPRHMHREAMIEREQQQGEAEIDEEHSVECHECRKKRCSARNCMLPPHPGDTCIQAARLRVDADESLRRYGESLGNDNLKKCPSCTMVIEKQAGCNHMHCTKCNTHFCWLCGFKSDTIREVYAHMTNVHNGFGEEFAHLDNPAAGAPPGIQHPDAEAAAVLQLLQNQHAQLEVVLQDVNGGIFNDEEAEQDLIWLAEQIIIHQQQQQQNFNN